MSEWKVGDTIFVSWANVQWETQDCAVTRGVVEAIGGGSIVFRYAEHDGIATVNVHAGDRAHRTEAEAWDANAKYFRDRAASILTEAERCKAKAAVEVVA